VSVWHRVCDHLKHTLASIGPPKTPPLANQASANCGF
jgi:hypothetical protein